MIGSAKSKYIIKSEILLVASIVLGWLSIRTSEVGRAVHKFTVGTVRSEGYQREYQIFFRKPIPTSSEAGKSWLMLLDDSSVNMA